MPYQFWFHCSVIASGFSVHECSHINNIRSYGMLFVQSKHDLLPLWMVTVVLVLAGVSDLCAGRVSIRYLAGVIPSSRGISLDSPMWLCGQCLIRDSLTQFQGIFCVQKFMWVFMLSAHYYFLILTKLGVSHQLILVKVPNIKFN